MIPAVCWYFNVLQGCVRNLWWFLVWLFFPHSFMLSGEVQLINVNSKMRKIEIIFKAKKAHLPLGENIIFSKDIDSLDLQYFMRLCRI